MHLRVVNPQLGGLPRRACTTAPRLLLRPPTPRPHAPWRQVDPIVASFCGGAVGVVSALLVVELNNVEKQQKNKCGLEAALF